MVLGYVVVCAFARNICERLNFPVYAPISTVMKMNLFKANSLTNNPQCNLNFFEGDSKRRSNPKTTRTTQEPETD